MKQFWKGVMEWKTGASLMFTAAMFFYLFFSWLYGNQTVSTMMLWTLLLACIAGAFIQMVCFSEWLIKKMRYTLRSLLFVAMFLPTLALLAWRAEWFPTEEAGAWAMFIGMFFLIFIAMTIGFDIYYRIAGRKYDGMLGRYRREKEEKGE